MKKESQITVAPIVDTTNMPSRTTLDAAPSRALLFLRTVANDTKVAASLRSCGYTAEDHEEGWQLLLSVAGFKEQVVESLPARVSAQLELEGWITTGFRRAQVALDHKNPDEAAFVFNGLEVSRGPEAILTIAHFLDRCDELESGPDRKSTRKADQAALETLARRGIGAGERKRLRSLIATCQEANDGVGAETVSDRTTKLLALHAWVQDWSETARTVITSRAMLIRLGAAKRRKNAPQATTPVTPVVVVQPPTPPAPPVVTLPALPPGPPSVVAAPEQPPAAPVCMPATPPAPAPSDTNMATHDTLSTKTAA